jgi:hypothetical protein
VVLIENHYRILISNWSKFKQGGKLRKLFQKVWAALFKRPVENTDGVSLEILSLVEKFQKRKKLRIHTPGGRRVRCPSNNA